MLAAVKRFSDWNSNMVCKRHETGGGYCIAQTPWGFVARTTQAWHQGPGMFMTLYVKCTKRLYKGIVWLTQAVSGVCTLGSYRFAFQVWTVQVQVEWAV